MKTTKYADHKFAPHLSKRANKLRKQATVGEKKLWHCLQKLRLSAGIRFRRQQPIGVYIADFYCATFKCVVEIDGSSHDARQTEDGRRQSCLTSLGISVFRFTEQEAQHQPEQIIDTILAHFNNDISAAPTPPLTPPSRGGED